MVDLGDFLPARADLEDLAEEAGVASAVGVPEEAGNLPILILCS